MTTTSQAILITGCSTGIGRATAVRLAATGRPVYATARREETIADLRDAGCRTLSLDVTDEGSMRAAVDHVVEQHGAVGALVNNAGYSQSGAVETVTPDALRRQFETNVFGLVRMSQLVLPGMRGQGSGRIVNISSMGANFTFPGGGVYHATKYAVEALSDALRFEVAGFGVGVSIIQPGLIRTEFASTAGNEISAEDGPYAEFNASVAAATKEVYEKGPLAKLGGDPDDVAKAIEKAITARKAPIRVRVTPSAHLLVGQRRLMTARMWDMFVGTQFKRPGA
ncbi:SDR family NAD(P)-dependent oxidoreductase [Paraconexibacter sp.]|uniref:SDR family NAD(P)-dependent oxidoreductase n=1 Tax=Paraconexibacter sp. TaxID=2949640 RepID=UPI003567D66F